MKRTIVILVSIAGLFSVLTAQIDLSMTEITCPEDVEEPDVGFLCQCSINNNTAETVYARVEFEIRHPASYPCYFTDTLYDYPLEPGANVAEATREFIPELGQEVQAYFMVTHPDDTYEDNNSLIKDFEISSGIDEEPPADFFAGFGSSNELQVHFTLPDAARTLLSLWDVTGKLVSIQSDAYPEGSHTVSLNTPELSSGVYFVRFAAPGLKRSVKVVKIN